MQPTSAPNTPRAESAHIHPPDLTALPRTASAHIQPVDLSSWPKTALLTDDQATIAIGVTKGTLSVWRSTGRYALPYVKAGRLVRYRVGDILDFLEARTRHGHGGAGKEA